MVLFGNPEMITADIRKQRDNAVADDYFELWLHYKELKVSLKSGMLVKENSPRYVLHGTEGSFVKYGMDPQEEMLKKGIVPNSDDWGHETKENWGMYCRSHIRNSGFNSQA